MVIAFDFGKTAFPCKAREVCTADAAVGYAYTPARLRARCRNGKAFFVGYGNCHVLLFYCQKCVTGVPTYTYTPIGVIGCMYVSVYTPATQYINIEIVNK